MKVKIDFNIQLITLTVCFNCILKYQFVLTSFIPAWHHGPQCRKVTTSSLGAHRSPSWQRPLWSGEIFHLLICRKRLVRFINMVKGIWSIKTWHLNCSQNVFSVVSLSRLILPHFEARGQGSFALMSSTAGKVGVPFSGTYTGSKHALHVSF